MSESKALYQTTAVNTGGRDGESYLKDGDYSVKITTPKKLGGSDAGQNPEQLFALGYSACYNGALELKMKKAGVKGKSRVSAEVTLNSDPTDNGFKISVKLTVAIDGQPTEVVQDLANQAHAFCPYSKATQGNIVVDVVTEDY